MKRIIGLILSFFLPAIIIYLTFAFGSWDFNAGKWSEPARVFCAAVSLIIGIGCVGAYLSTKNNQP